MRWIVVAAIVVTWGRAAAEPAKVVSIEAARGVLPGAPGSCADVACLIDASYARDARARALAQALYREAGSVAGVGPEEIMDGGYRGKIRLVPQLPTGGYRKHLAWIVDATRSFDRFFGALFAGRAAPRYRWHAIELRFVRSVGKRTPSAYALNWRVAYNVAGSLMTSADGVRETFFHELFHLNDGAHGDWSARALRRDYDAILARCPKRTRRCLAPYAPNTTTVRGGTFYAFQPDNGDSVHEYAAELAVRYWKEHQRVLAGKRLRTRPFKCAAPENARAWKALVDEFFGGRDLTPAC